MKKFDDFEDELNQISPFLQQLKNQAKHNSDDMPNNYFADFEQKMMQKIADLPPEKNNLKIVKNEKQIQKWVWVAAASLWLTASTFLFFYQNNHKINTELADYQQILQTVSKDDITAYLQERPDELDLGWLALQENETEELQLSALDIEHINNDSILKEELLEDVEEADFW